jgi:N-methylhydantoinase A
VPGLTTVTDLEMPRVTAANPVRLAVDVGGTFTDVVLEDGPRRWTTKVLTTPARPEDGVLEGVSAILRLSGRRLEDVGLFVHGTTLATNAVIERRGARIGLLATQGFRDILDIASESRYDQYELALQRPVPLAPREHRFTVPERMDVHGAVRLPLDEEAVAALVPSLRAERLESLAIAFLHSYANPAHERRAAEILRAAMPELALSLSSEVCPEIREYERTSTTTVNAYVQPLMERYLSRMQVLLAEAGFGGAIALMTSGGGLTSIDTARRLPVRLVESGPAGGAIFATGVAARLGERKVIAFDMGGTTAKITLIQDFAAETGRMFEVDRVARFLKGSGLPVRIPVIELVEIGAGGGSIAQVDALRRVTVGPESASSLPGPACYGRGGTRPAVTDANVLLGLLDPDAFAGGSIRLQPDLSRAALERDVGAPLGMGADMAAHAVYETVCENMASAARVHAVERGAVASQHAVIAFGGAAPLHVCRVAEKIGASRVIVPPNAGVGSAVGFLAAPVAFEVVRSQHMRLEEFDTLAATALLTALSAEVLALVTPAAQGAPLAERRLVFMRYIGQGHEITVELPPGGFAEDAAATMRSRFEEAYTTLFGRCIPQAGIEILAWSVTMSTPAALDIRARQPRPDGAVPEPAGFAPFFDGRSGQQRQVPRYNRAGLAQGACLTGPAVIVEDETSTYVTASFDAWMDDAGCIVMERRRDVQESRA